MTPRCSSCGAEQPGGRLVCPECGHVDELVLRPGPEPERDWIAEEFDLIRPQRDRHGRYDVDLTHALIGAVVVAVCAAYVFYQVWLFLQPAPVD